MAFTKVRSFYTGMVSEVVFDSYWD